MIILLYEYISTTGIDQDAYNSGEDKRTAWNATFL